MSLVEAKRRLRREATLLRDGLDRREPRSRDVAQRFEADPRLAKAESVALFAPIRSEVDPGPVGLRRRTAYPKITGRTLEFRWSSAEQLTPRPPYGIPEPGSDQPHVDLTELDVLVVPGLAFDGAGRRLGYGGGYYDRLLKRLRDAAVRPLVVGVAFSAQVIEFVPHDHDDEPIDVLVTEDRVRWFDVEATPGRR